MSLCVFFFFFRTSGHLTSSSRAFRAIGAAKDWLCFVDHLNLLLREELESRTNAMDQFRHIMKKAQRFVNMKEDLPLAGGSRQNNGIKGIPTVDRWVALTLFWALCFLAVIGYGFNHCRTNAYSYSFVCTNNDCRYTAEDRAFGVSNIIQFPKSDFLDAEMVRIDSNGEYVDGSKARSDPKRYYGYSIRLKLRLPPEPDSRMKIERSIIFNPHDMTRRVARNGAKTLSDSISKDQKDVSYSKSAMVTSIGVIAIFLGFLGLLLTCLFGQWSEYNPRKLKKAS